MNRINRKLNSRKRIISFRTAAVLMASFVLTGCQVPGISKIAGSGSCVFQVGSEKCSEAEAKMILLSLQKSYSSLYGIDMWERDYSEGCSLEEYVRDLTVSQLAEVYTLDTIAGEQEFALTEEEQEQVADAAKEYYDGLSDAEKDYLNVDESEVESLFARYLLADRLYGSLTEDVTQEVSDDEARVMDVAQICMSDSDTAESVKQQLNSGADFTTLASSYNEADALNRSVTRTTFSSSVTDALFSLDTGAHSDILEEDGSYYIFYCVNSFNESMTEQNKASVLEQRMEDLVNHTYASYADSLDSSLNDDVWSQVELDVSLKLDSASFLEVYESYFGEA